MRLLLLTPEYSGFGGGIITYYRSLAPELRAAGVELHIIEGSGVYSAEDHVVHKRDGLAIETLEHTRLVRWKEKFSAFSGAPGLSRHLAAAWAMWEQASYGADYDVVEATDWGLLFVPPAVEATRPLVVQCHGSIGQIADYDPLAENATENILVRLIESDLLATAADVQTYSRANAAFWSAETGRNVTAVLPAWSATGVVESKGLGERGLVVGRLQRWKGPEVVCGALRHLGGRAPCVDWVGRSTPWGRRDNSASAQLARTFPEVWGTKLFHHAQISPAEVAHRQAHALFNIVPSTWDVFNFTAVEAMVSGRPTIVSTGAGASELIEDGVNGYLFAKDDAGALAETIERVLSENPARLAEIAREGRNTIRRALDPKAIAAQHVAAYRTAIDAFKTRPTAPVGGWLGTICRPSDATGIDMNFLENFPLRVLTKHVAGRISRRLILQ